jgi:lysophospholipid acyltransferase (LPLAT)-like uncharacterized protein
VPICSAAARPSRAWWLRSWDRFCIPKPFATIEVVYGAPVVVAAGKDGLRAGIEAVEQGLHGVTHAS